MNRASNALVSGDYSLSLKLNQLSQRRSIRELFAVVSRIGDGTVWYWTILALPLLFGMDGIKAALALAMAASSGVLIYHTIKKFFRRARPFKQYPNNIKAAAVALDEWSFPSGHTLHATAYTIILLQLVPALGWVFLPFAILTGLSRVILGLHYPSDVAFGALLGAALANVALEISAIIWAL